MTAGVAAARRELARHVALRGERQVQVDRARAAGDAERRAWRRRACARWSRATAARGAAPSSVRMRSPGLSAGEVGGAAVADGDDAQLGAVALGGEAGDGARGRLLARERQPERRPATRRCAPGSSRRARPARGRAHRRRARARRRRAPAGRRRSAGCRPRDRPRRAARAAPRRARGVPPLPRAHGGVDAERHQVAARVVGVPVVVAVVGRLPGQLGRLLDRAAAPRRRQRARSASSPTCSK